MPPNSSLVISKCLRFQFFTKYAICVCEKMSRRDLIAEYFGRHITWVDFSVSKRITPRVYLAAQVEWPTSVKIRKLDANVAYYDDHHVAVFSGRNISMTVRPVPQLRNV